jgi:aspartate aminotransferase
MTRARAGTVLSRRALRIEVSPTVAMAQRAAALKARGETVLDFSVGEPDQDTPQHVRAAAVAALEAGRTRYAPAAGVPELRAAIAARYAQDFQVTFAPAEVAVTVGGKQALYLVCQALLEGGDEVVVPTPHWPTFAESVRLAGARPVFVGASEKGGFKITARMISKATGPRTRAVILNSPSNPTGAVVDPGELRAIGALAARRGFTVLYDDTYAQLGFGGAAASGLRALRESAAARAVVIGTASKTYCMTGWRIGWVLGERTLVDACAALVSHSTQGPATFAQLAAVAALAGPQDRVRALAAEYRRRRDAIHPILAGIPGVTCVEPEGGFYFFPNVARYLGPAMPTTLDLGARLLDECKVAVVPGEGFGAPGHLRVSFARPIAELEEGARRIASFLGSLREARP